MKDKDHIEKFFEERLSGKHFVFRESDWEMMEQKLEASQLNEEKSSGAFWRKWIVVISALIIAFFLGWYGNKFIENKEGEKVESFGFFNEAASSIPSENNEVSGEELTAIDPGRKIDEHSNSLKEEKPDNKPARDLEQSANATSSNAYSNISFATKKESENNSPASVAEAPVFSSPDFIERKNKITIPLKEPEGHGNLVLFEPAAEDSVTKAELKQYKFSIGLSYAPDLTSAGFFNRQQLAQSVGIQFYYQLTQKWILQTGINYVKKKYEAEPDNYQPYEDYWQQKTYGKVPDDIYGNCSVIDVPVNITYKWSDSGRLSFLTTAGVSNYFLLDQEYFYEFNNYSKYSYGWSTTENSKFIGGIINASFGLSIKVNERTNIQVEPYLKIPLKDIGYGNLKLFSTGSFFTVKYVIF